MKLQPYLKERECVWEGAREGVRERAWEYVGCVGVCMGVWERVGRGEGVWESGCGRVWESESVGECVGVWENVWRMCGSVCGSV